MKIEFGSVLLQIRSLEEDGRRWFGTNSEDEANERLDWEVIDWVEFE